MDRTEFLVNLRNQGIEFIPKYKTEYGLTISFWLTKEEMKKFKTIKKRNKIIEDFLDELEINKVDSNIKLNYDEQKTLISENNLIFEKYKRRDYRFNSVYISHRHHKKLKDIQDYYKISRSSVIRMIAKEIIKSGVFNENLQR